MKRLTVPIFNTKVWFSTDAKTSLIDNVAGCVGPYKTGLYIGVFDGSLQTLTHECTHLAVRILKGIGHPDINDTNDEVLAYLTDYLFGRLHKELPCSTD